VTDIQQPKKRELRPSTISGKYVAKLTGETDGHTVSREFRDEPNAIAWVLGAGLADFDDQTASGEVRSGDGRIVWAKSHLQTPEHADRDEKLKWRRFFARHNFTRKKR
jgi:hypothetical protein